MNKYFGTVSSGSEESSSLTEQDINTVKTLSSAGLTNANVSKLASMDQAVATTSSPQFFRLGVNGPADPSIALNVNGSINILSNAFIRCNSSTTGSDIMFLNLKNSNGYGTYLTTTTNTTNGTGIDFKYNDYNNGGGIRNGVALGISSSGKIGVGQSGGTEQLEVTGNIKSTGSIKLINSTFPLTISPATLTAAHTLTLPNADLVLTANSGPDQSVSTTATPRFAKLGIAQAAGTEVLEVTGNIKCSNNLMAAGAFLSGLLPISDGSLLRIKSGILYSDNGFNQALATTSSPQFVKLGVGQAAGTEALEVTGNVKSTGSLKLVNSMFPLTITPSTLTAARALTLPDADLTLTANSAPNQSVSTTGTPQFSKLGVGTPAGSYALSVLGDTAITGALTIGGALTCGTFTPNGLGVSGSNTSTIAAGATVNDTNILPVVFGTYVNTGLYLYSIYGKTNFISGAAIVVCSSGVVKTVSNLGDTTGRISIGIYSTTLSYTNKSSSAETGFGYSIVKLC